MLPVGSDDSFIAAMKQGAIDAGMIEEPIASRLLASGDAKVLVDMRSVEGTVAALGGAYAGSCFYAQREWVNSHPDEAQKLVRALVRSLAFIATHSAEEITARVPRISTDRDRARRCISARSSPPMPMFTKTAGCPTSARSRAERAHARQFVDRSASYRSVEDLHQRVRGPCASSARSSN